MGEILKSSHNLLNSIPATLLLTDVHSKILYANRQAESFFGYAPEEMAGQRMRVLFLEEDLIYFLPNILYLTRYKDGFDGEVLLRRKDGGRIFVRLFSTLFRETNEIFLAFAFQEIQRLKNLEREKLEVERWVGLGRMVEEIAHQFRNPISSIGGYANRLEKRLPVSPKSRIYINQILQEVRRLEAILQRVEEYVQIPSPVLHKERIQEVAQAALTDFSKNAKIKGISIQLDTAGLTGDGQLFIDRGVAVKVLSHILHNSLEALQGNSKGEAKGSVKIALFDDGESVGVTISDRGQGIAKNNLGQIFDPFFTTRPDRVGLGLTFAQRVMEEHGGRIQVESRLHRGTKITLYFPKDRRRKVRREWISPQAMAKEDS